MNWHDRRIRDSATEWVTSSLARYSNLTFVTLTLKQGRQRKDGTWQPITRTIAESQVRWFLRELDRSVFGKAASRYGKKLSRISALEGGDILKRLHAHLLIETPPNGLTAGEFKSLITDTWRKANWGHEIVHIEQVRDHAKAIRYVLKTGLDAIDMESTFMRPLFAKGRRPQQNFQKNFLPKSQSAVNLCGS